MNRFSNDYSTRTTKYEYSGPSYEQKYKSKAEEYWKLSSLEQTEEERELQDLVDKMRSMVEQFRAEINELHEMHDNAIQKRDSLINEYQTAKYALDVEELLMKFRTKI